MARRVNEGIHADPSVAAWLWPVVQPEQVSNVQYALSTMAQAYATVLGILLTIGVALAQFGGYRIPISLFLRLSWGEVLILVAAGVTVILPVVALSLDVLELHRVCLLLFILGIVLLPMFAAQVIRRTRPAFYVPKLLKARKGWSSFGDGLVSLAIQASDKREWRTLAMMTAALGQLRLPDPTDHLERGYGYQQGLPQLVHHLVDEKNDRGLRVVLESVRYGACVFPTTSILDVDETRSRFRNWLRYIWLVRPGWIHELQARLAGDRPLLQVPESYDYGILLHLTQAVQSLVRADKDKPGEPVLPSRVGHFREWAQLLAAVVYSTYLLDEAAKDDERTPSAKTALWQARSWERLLGTVDARVLRDALIGTPNFPGSLGGFPRRYPKSLQERSRARTARLTPAKTRAGNRLVQAAIKAQAMSHPVEASNLFWPDWTTQEGKVLTVGRRYSEDAVTLAQ